MRPILERMSFPFLVAVLGSGCVMIDSTLTIDHAGVMKAAAREGTPVFLVGVSDIRPDTRRIGCKKTGTGSESADLFLDVPLTLWFGGVLNEELRRAGLRLTGAEDPSAARVEVALQHFFIEPDTTLWGWDVHALVCAEITVRFPDGSGFVRRIAARNNSSSMFGTDGAFVEVMQRAMESWILQAVPAIVQLIESHRNPGRALGAGWRRWS